MITGASSRPTRQWSTRVYLNLFAITLILPMLAFAGVLLWRYGMVERARLERAALQQTRDIAQAVDAQVANLLSSARILSFAPVIREGQLEETYRLMDEVARELGMLGALRSVDGQQLINTAAPFGAPLPKAPLSTDADVLRTRTPQVSDLFVGAVTQKPMFSVTAPVFGQNGEILYLLNLSYPVERLRDLLTNRPLPPNWIVAIVDRNGLIIARNIRHEEFVGTPATGNLQDNTSGREGTWEGVTLDGQDVFGAFSRASLSDWRVAIGVQWSELAAPLKESMSLLAAAGFGVLALSGWMAWTFGNRFSTPIRHLADAAARVGQSQAVPPIQSSIREIGQVGEALSGASMELHERQKALRESEERLRIVIDAGQMAVWEHDIQAGTILLSAKLNQLFGLPLDARPRLRDLKALVCPGEIERIWAAFQEAIRRQESFLEMEICIQRPDRQRRWILYRGVIIATPDGRPAKAAGLLLDITDRKNWEEHQQLLINELNHRVKNTLATVQSIATQSLRSAQTPQDAQEAIESRLFALSRLHNLLTREHWEGVNLKEVVAEALEPYAYMGETRLRIMGPDARLSPRMALPIAMTLQELATNAVKYGSLSNGTGQIHVSWNIKRDSNQRRLQLRWAESGGPAVKKPSRRGFGTRLIERSLAWELGGAATIDFAPEGLVCTVDVPMT